MLSCTVVTRWSGKSEVAIDPILYEMIGTDLAPHSALQMQFEREMHKPVCFGKDRKLNTGAQELFCALTKSFRPWALDRRLGLAHTHKLAGPA